MRLGGCDRQKPRLNGQKENGRQGTKPWRPPHGISSAREAGLAGGREFPLSHDAEQEPDHRPQDELDPHRRDAELPQQHGRELLRHLVDVGQRHLDQRKHDQESDTGYDRGVPRSELLP